MTETRRPLLDGVIDEQLRGVTYGMGCAPPGHRYRQLLRDMQPSYYEMSDAWESGDDEALERALRRLAVLFAGFGRFEDTR